MKHLVVCGNCEVINGSSIQKWSGRGFNIEVKRPGAMVLGEVNNNGDFLIKRGGQYYTKVIGNEFTILCGQCGNPVYRKEVPNGTLAFSYQRVSWVHRGTSISKTETTGTQNNSYS